MTKPKPFTDPHIGQWQAVVSWRVPPRPILTITAYRDAVEESLRQQLGDHADLYVTVYEITAPSEDEGRYDHPAALANLDDVQHVRATEDIQAKDKRL